MRTVGGCVLIGYLLFFPERSMDAVLRAMVLWAERVAPGMFPFLCVMPLVTEALRGREYGPGGALYTLFGISGAGIPAVITGLIAGSPAGAAAVRRAYARDPSARDEAFRCLMLASGIGPVFLMCSVGAGMLGDAGMGAKLIAAQFLSLFTCALFIRRLRLPARDVREEEASPVSRAGPVREAVLGVLTIGGWMALFSVIIRMADDVFPIGHMAYALEIATGCARASSGSSPALIGFVIGFGGLCVAAQNISAMRVFRVPPAMYLAVKALCGALCAGYTRVMTMLPIAKISDIDAVSLASALALCLSACLACSQFFKRRANA